MRSKKAFRNIVSSLLLQVVSIITGLIIPGLIISFYGSTTNGLIASITQFLGYITLLEAGVGGVTRAALYKPLAENNTRDISSIIKSTTKFFKKIGFIFLGYLLVLAFVLPIVIESANTYLFIFILVLIMGGGTFAQYYFGITNQLLLQADQKQYIIFYLQSVTIIINTVLIVLLIKIGLNIIVVQLISALIFIIRPIILNKYVKKNYKLIENLPDNDKAIEQRWDGLGHHIANTIHNSTDIVLITLFLNIKEVSVYSIYYLVVSGVKKISVTIFTGVESAFGNMLAKNEKENLDKNFNIFEFLIFSIISVLFTSTGILIVSFISIYTMNVSDVNYIRPVFAVLLTLSEAVYCIRIPYNTLTLAAGHYKETRNGAFLEATINITLSLILVNFLGITGVALGTLIAMVYRTLQLVVYLSNNILQRNILVFVKKASIYAFGCLLICIIVYLLPTYIAISFFDWILYAIMVFSIASVVVILIGLVFYKNEFIHLVNLLKRILIKSK